MTQAVTRKQIKIGEGISTMVLLVMLLFSVTGSIQTADWTDGLGILSFAAIGGMILGFILARLPARGRVTHPLGIVTAAWCAWLFTSILLPSELLLEEKLRLLAERFGAWMLQVLAGGESTDVIIFVMQASFVVWLIGYAAAWSVYRQHQAWGAILPTGALLVFNLFYAFPQSGFYFGMYLISALVLLVRLNLRSMEYWWRQSSIGYPPDIGFDFLYYGTLVALVLLFIAWAIPTTIENPILGTMLEPIQGPWRDMEDQFTRAFKNLRAAIRPAPTTIFGSRLSMGGPVHLGNRLVMQVKTNAPEYWRATTYDKFDGVNWTSTYSSTLLLAANDARLGIRQYAYRIQITETFKLHIAEPNALYAAAEPIQYDIPTQILYTRVTSNDSSEFDLTTTRPRRPLRDGDAYVVVSTPSAAYEDLLRADSTVYPDWVTLKYLQLPNTTTERVRKLATEITQPYSNPYDKAVALQNYLRTHITYNELVDAPPANRDGVDYLLFERPEGYCNYYASAMAVMARAVGIPTRIASGYGTGEYTEGAFQVVESNAHSWVEVYFPNYGWILFEPTASKPELARPQKPADAPSLSELEQDEARRRQPRDKDAELDKDVGAATALPVSWWENLLDNPIYLALTGIVLITLIATIIIGIIQWRHAHRTLPLSPVSRVYEEMIARARWIGIAEARYTTPLERAQKIALVLPQAQAESEQIAAFYTRERFSLHALDNDETAVLESTWNKWKEKWLRGFIAQTRQRIAAPLRIMLENARRFKRRVERM
jgi:transglutaminase-like putative cysteine protease